MGRFDNYKFRCSALGYIMGSGNELTIANKTHLLEVFIGEIYNTRKEITSKYFEKGTFMEEDGITLLNQTLYPNNLLVKNKERRANDYIHGECDTISPDEIIYDIKNAWDRFSFGKADLTFNYKWQLKGYCMLWNIHRGRLFYCLNNMPEHLLCDEERKLFYQHRFTTTEDPEYLSLCTELRKKHNYDDLPVWERFKTWDVDFTDEDAEKLRSRIILCRKHLNTLHEKHEEQISRNKQLMGLSPSVLLAEYDKGINATIIT